MRKKHASPGFSAFSADEVWLFCSCFSPGPSLAAEIAAGKSLKPLEATGDADWDDLLAPLLNNGETWLSAPWWISENYFY